MFGYSNTFDNASNTMVLGNANIAYGNNSLVAGSTVINDNAANSIAIGSNVRIFGDQSCALGISTTARGDNVLVFGNNTSAGGANSGGMASSQGTEVYSYLYMEKVS